MFYKTELFRLASFYNPLGVKSETISDQNAITLEVVGTHLITAEVFKRITYSPFSIKDTETSYNVEEQLIFQPFKIC